MNASTVPTVPVAPAGPDGANRASSAGRSLGWYEITRKLFEGAAILIVPLVSAYVALDALLRYAFNSPLTGTADVVGVGLFLLVCAGLPYSYLAHFHVRMDMVYLRLGRWQSLVHVVSAISALMVGGVLAYRAWLSAWQSWQTSAAMPSGQIALWPIQLFGAVCCLLLCGTMVWGLRRQLSKQYERTVVRDGMCITWNTSIRMKDGTVLRADVFRPVDLHAKSPVIISHGVYAKGHHYEEVFKIQWDKMVEDHPEVLEGSTNKYQNWEVADPERWVPHGYAVVRVDSRGCGWSEGILNPFSPQETDDFCETIEWAAAQAWSSGVVGVLGVSYYAHMGWRVAQRRPKGLAAIIAWEAFIDMYRDTTYHGGILSEFSARWAALQSVTVQYGVGTRARQNPITGDSIAGPVDLSDDELERRRLDTFTQAKEFPLDGPYWHAQRPDPAQITMPFLSCANWGGMGIHPRGNFTGFVESPSRHKWLEVHGETHWSLFSAKYGLDLQRRFFDRFLKGEDNGWDRTAPVLLNVRHVDGRFERRDEQEWPLARTQWTRHYLEATGTLARTAPAAGSRAEYATMGKGLRFRAPPVTEPTEITGPIAAKLFIESATIDADLFLIVQVFDPAGKELTFMGAQDPNTPIAMGWLRASHRALDPARSKPWQPYHRHDKVEPLTPGQIVEVAVEILPTSIVLPVGWSIGLQVRGCDYEYEGEPDRLHDNYLYQTRGTGGVLHEDIDNRPPKIFDTTVTLHCGSATASYLLLPMIPRS